MSQMTREQTRAFVEQWKRAGPELERIHWEELRQYRYNPSDADAILSLGDSYDGPERVTSGLVEMQRWFMKFAEQQGLRPRTVREKPATYDSKRPTKRRISKTARPPLPPKGSRGAKGR